MELNEYIKWSLSIAVYPSDLGIAYCGIGLVDETIECLDKIVQGAEPEEIKSELGDVLWYMARCFDELGYDMVTEIQSTELPKTQDITDIHSDFLVETGKYLGKCKKLLRGDGVTPEVMLPFLKSAYAYYLLILAANDLYLDQVLEYNYNKLEGRRANGTIQGSGDHR
jgi:NTP pyrophosphatase (non-canonical NTP hydrolase)